MPLVLEVHQEVARGLGHPRTGGVGGEAEQVHAAGLDLDQEQDTYTLFRVTVSTWKKPSLRASPTIRWYPQRGFSCARCTTRSTVPRATHDGCRCGGTRPPARDQIAVPAQQRCRGNEEDRPPVAGQNLRHGSQDQPVSGGEPRSCHLTVQHTDLVAQDRDLDVLGIR